MPTPLFHNGVNEMELVDYLKAARMTPEQWEAWKAEYGVPKPQDLAFAGEDLYEAHQAHAEYCGARH